MLSGRVRIQVVALAVVALAASSGTAWGQSANVSAYPSPGTPTASARTQITLRGVAPEAIGEISVAGSRSGHHPGRLVPHPDGLGASFLPQTRFRAGERVRVRTKLGVVGGRDGDFTFTIARAAPHGALYAKRYDIDGAVYRFRSRPRLRPPRLTVTHREAGIAPGLLFLGPKGGPGQDGAMAVDRAGRLVWFKPMPRREQAINVRVQAYRDRPVLTWWQGRVLKRGYGVGRYVLADSAYRTVATVHAGNGYRGDHHDFVLTPRGSALLLAYSPVRMDLRRYGGPRNGLVWDSVLQEVDIESGLVLFEWHSLAEVDLRESYSPVPEHPRRGWDHFHINSVQELEGGDLLVSARNTHTVYRIDRASGEIVWRLGGKRSDFRMGKDTRFAWQHDARVQPDGTITLFDNQAAPPLAPQSRGIEIELDAQGKRATLRRERVHRPGLLAISQGSMQVLPNGNTLLSWGPERHVSEFDSGGEMLFDARFPRATDTYRAYRYPWVGVPGGRPAIAVRRAGRDRVRVYASWNGATEVARWEVLAGPSPKRLRTVGSAPRRGFETSIVVSTRAARVAVRALAADGSALGTSAAVRR